MAKITVIPARFPQSSRTQPASAASPANAAAYTVSFPGNSSGR